MEKVRTVIGIDVVKSALDVWVHPSGKYWRTDHDAAGLEVLIDTLTPLAPSLVVVEATGGLEIALTAALGAAGLPVVMVNPRQVRDFAKATGRLAKTDKLDAQVLAQFGATVNPPVRPLPDAQCRELQAMVTRRQQLIGMLTAEKNRMAQTTPRVRHQKGTPSVR